MERKTRIKLASSDWQSEVLSLYDFRMAPEEGIEPESSEASKTSVLPLNDSGKTWLARQATILQPPASETGAPPIELLANNRILAHPEGYDPPTFRLTAERSAN